MRKATNFVALPLGVPLTILLSVGAVRAAVVVTAQLRMAGKVGNNAATVEARCVRNRRSESFSLTPLPGAAQALKRSNQPAAASQDSGDRRSLAAVSNIVVQNGGAGKTWVDIAMTAPTPYHVEHMDHPWRVVVDLQDSRTEAPQRVHPVGSTLLKEVRVAQYRATPSHVVRVVAVLAGNTPFNVEQRQSGIRIELEAPSDGSDGVPYGATASASASMTEQGTGNKERGSAAAPLGAQAATLASQSESPAKAEPLDGSRAMAQAPSLAKDSSPSKQQSPAQRSGFGPDPIPQLASMTPTLGVPPRTRDSASKSNGPSLLRAAFSQGDPPTAQQPPAPTPPATVPSPPANSQNPTPSSGSQTITLVPEAQGRTAAPTHYTGELVSMNLKDVDLKDFFRMIHEVSGLNIVVDSDVSGTVTLVIDRVPWDQVLDLVLHNNGLGKVLDGNVLRIAKLETLEKEQEESVKLADAQEDAEPLVTVIIPLKYASAIDRTPTQATVSAGGATGGLGGGGGSQQQNVIIPGVVSILTGHVSSAGSSGGGGGGGLGQGRSVLSKRGTAIPDTRNNSIILSEVPSRLGLVESVIAKLDTPAKQVSIEARIVVANSDFVRNIQSALNFGSVNPSGSTVTGGATGTGATAQGNVPSPSTGGTTTPPRVTIGQTTTSGFGAFAISNQSMRYFINAAISAAETHDQAKTISAPTIVTQNNWPAMVVQGVQIPIQTTINNTISTQFVDAALTLQVTPTVTEGGHLFLQLSVANNSVGAVLTGATGPSINTQAATTQVMVPDGGTVVFGGVKLTTRTRSLTQVPLLGDIPVLGNLFKSSNIEDSDQELLFFVSPKILPD